MIHISKEIFILINFLLMILFIALVKNILLSVTGEVIVLEYHPIFHERFDNIYVPLLNYSFLFDKSRKFASISTL